mmetsp:Transcript_6734/g.22672  ORF Transcript_6734/g.22672 Transcript_6734/m.22672 type:complete len:361 (-) Transcript_6734:204-1286(-)
MAAASPGEGSGDPAALPAQNIFSSYYAQLSQQSSMLADSVRTGTYQTAILGNSIDFTNKVVLDVGTGTGILALFAAQAGARKVYAVEASDVANAARELVAANGFQDRVEVIQGKAEEVELPEKVDVIVSEPIGFLLVHERMLETYVVARQRFLKPGGLMMPTTGAIVLAPVTDEATYNEQMGKVAFWNNSNFYGLDMRHLMERATDEYFAQPVVGFFAPQQLLSSQRTAYRFDFSVATCEELRSFEIPFSFIIERTAVMHGFGAWFDASFNGSESQVVLSTAPECPGTHWYQCRLLLREPLGVNRGQTVSGTMSFSANAKFSYDIHISVELEGTSVSSSGRVRLQDQMYQYLSSTREAHA